MNSWNIIGWILISGFGSLVVTVLCIDTYLRIKSKKITNKIKELINTDITFIQNEKIVIYNNSEFYDVGFMLEELPNNKFKIETKNRGVLPPVLLRTKKIEMETADHYCDLQERWT